MTKVKAEKLAKELNESGITGTAVKVVFWLSGFNKLTKVMHIRGFEVNAKANSACAGRTIRRTPGVKILFEEEIPENFNISVQKASRGYFGDELAAVFANYKEIK